MAISFFDRSTRWNAKWIWLDYITPFSINSHYKSERVVGVLPSEKNRWCLFRHTFFLDERVIKSQSSTIRISVDSRYKLFINGVYIGRGIYRCDKYNWYFDEYDVSGVLRTGKNVISVLATFYGEYMSWYEPLPNGIVGPKTVGKGSLLFQLDIQTDRGIHSIFSDKTTRGKVCEAWQQNVPRINIGLPFVEKFDSNKWEFAWLTAEFEDARLPDWQNAIELNLGPSIIPLVKCEIPRLKEIPMVAEKLITAGTFEEYFDDEDLMEPEDAHHDKIDEFVRLQFSIQSNNLIRLCEAYNASPSAFEISLKDGPIGLVFDMGKTVSGFPFFSIDSDSEDVEIVLAWSEKITDKKGVKVLNADLWKTKSGLIYRCRKGKNEFQSFHWFGYRYLQMNIRPISHSNSEDCSSMGACSGSVLKIREVGTVLYTYPVECIGAFECSNPEWNRLFEVCAWTMRNCMHDGFEDCPSREQRQWVGDAYVETMLAYALFGETKLTKKLIDQTAQSQRGDNLTQMVTPGDTFIHGLIIPDYCLYYISTVYEYWRYTGDKSVLTQHLPVILRAIRWFLQFLDPKTGLITNVPQWIFIDWSSNDKWGANGVINAQVYNALQQITEMVSIANWGDACAGFEKICAKIKENLNLYFWNESRSAYVDAIDFDAEGRVVKRSDKITFHTNCFMLLYDLAPQDRAKTVLETVFSVPYSRLYVQNASPLWCGKNSEKYKPETGVIMAEPFFMHHVNQMFAKFDRFDLMARFINDGWCEMLRKGATSIWETWGDHGSLCHAWSCTPAFDLIRHCLGVSILEPGASKIRIQPNPMGLNWAKGIIPTIHGPVYIDWKIEPLNSKIKIKYRSPPNVKVELGGL